VSADGKVIVGSSSSHRGSEAFRWEGGRMTGLGMLQGGRDSAAFGVSAEGRVVVGKALDRAGVQQAFRWEDGVMVRLGSLPGGRDTSIAFAVSSEGSTIVGKANSHAGPQAFRWKAGVFEALGDLEGGAFRSFAFAVSADGKVVVGRGAGAGNTLMAFRWEDGTISALDVRTQAQRQLKLHQDDGQ
jgi:probable HAF family extracellular repeat protein